MKGKTVLVTGATAGIGRQTALELAKRGAQVVLVGRDPAKTEQVVAELRAASSEGGDGASCFLPLFNLMVENKGYVIVSC